MKEICKYCSGELFQFGACVGCGSRSSAAAIDTRPKCDRGEPFIYNGVVVWPITDWGRNVIHFQFYLGDRLIQNISLSRDLLKTLSDQFGDGADTFELVWKMFEVACGDSDMETILDNSRRVPAVIAMTRVEYPKEMLTWENLIEHYKQHPGMVIKLRDFANYL